MTLPGRSAANAPLRRGLFMFSRVGATAATTRRARQVPGPRLPIPWPILTCALAKPSPISVAKPVKTVGHRQSAAARVVAAARARVATARALHHSAAGAAGRAQVEADH